VCRVIGGTERYVQVVFTECRARRPRIHGATGDRDGNKWRRGVARGPACPSRDAQDWQWAIGTVYAISNRNSCHGCRRASTDDA
jgi:hypothetical protein